MTISDPHFPVPTLDHLLASAAIWPAITTQHHHLKVITFPASSNIGCPAFPAVRVIAVAITDDLRPYPLGRFLTN